MYLITYDFNRRYRKIYHGYYDYISMLNDISAWILLNERQNDSIPFNCNIKKEKMIHSIGLTRIFRVI